MLVDFDRLDDLNGEASIQNKERWTFEGRTLFVTGKSSSDRLCRNFWNFMREETWLMRGRAHHEGYTGRRLQT